MLANSRSQDPSDKKGGQLYRRRFRVPFPVYLEILAMMRTNGWFTEGRDAISLVAAPLELKILSVLRVLGRGYCFDGVEELCFISAEVLRTFFHKFCACFAAKYFSVYCTPPATPEEIKHTTGVYARIGVSEAQIASISDRNVLEVVLDTRGKRDIRLFLTRSLLTTASV